MFRDEKLELRVGLFMGAGFFLMFLMVFFLKDFSLFDKGYNIQVIFDTVGGITKNAPVKLAGINVGEVKLADIFQDKTENRPRVKLDVRVDGNVSIPEDAVIRINTLGLLGEKYLEITPGVSKKYLAEGDVMTGENPISVSQQMEKMNAFMESAAKILQKIESGDGTLGKLLADDTIYNDVEVIMSRLRNGDGTLGKLLVKEDIYENVEEFTSDVKNNPWKLLHKTREKSSRSK
ncbi:MAG: MCE family protein [Candidatus Omnitrophica bacterium]|nr:MCE family protein [Candidatus Omnitrophota bacterium]